MSAPQQPSPGKGLVKATTWKSLRTVEDAAGGRAQLAEKLTFAALTPAQQRFLDLLHEPDREQDSLYSLCQQAGLRPFDVLEMLQSAAIATAMLEAQENLALALPGVVEDVARKAQDHLSPCACTRTPHGTTAANPKCSLCQGRGYTFKSGSFDHAQLVFEAGKMLPKAAGVSIKNENKTVVVGQGGDVFDAFVKATDAVLLPSGGTAPAPVVTIVPIEEEA